MKKLLAMILAILMALSAAACAKDDVQKDDESPKTEATMPKGEPTEEELQQLQAYADSLAILNDWVAGEIESVYYFDEATGEKRRSDLEFGPDYSSAALEYHYNVIANSTVVDKWAGTEWTSDPAVNWDKQAVLDNFIIVEDVALYETVKYMDHLDGVKDEIVANRYYYNELTQLETVKCIIAPNAWRGHTPLELVEGNPAQPFPGNRVLVAEYDDSDRMTAVRTESNNGNVMNKTTATYNEDNFLATMTNVTAKGETTTANYVYDEQNRIAQIQVAGEGYQRVFSYEYDAKGNITNGKMVYTASNGVIEDMDVVTELYSYNGKGQLESCQHTEENYTNGKLLYETKDVYTYECDEQGRPVKATVVPGDMMEVATGNATYWGKAEYAKAEHVVVYGTYYGYVGK